MLVQNDFQVIGGYRREGRVSYHVCKKEERKKNASTFIAGLRKNEQDVGNIGCLLVSSLGDRDGKKLFHGITFDIFRILNRLAFFEYIMYVFKVYSIQIESIQNTK